jgi:hypothetical protein
MRVLIENVIEEFLLLLDEIDGDAAFEDGDPDLKDDTELEFARQGGRQATSKRRLITWAESFGVSR